MVCYPPQEPSNLEARTAYIVAELGVVGKGQWKFQVILHRPGDSLPRGHQCSTADTELCLQFTMKQNGYKSTRFEHRGTLFTKLYVDSETHEARFSVEDRALQQIFSRKPPAKQRRQQRRLEGREIPPAQSPGAHDHDEDMPDGPAPGQQGPPSAMEAVDAGALQHDMHTGQLQTPPEDAISPLLDRSPSAQTVRSGSYEAQTAQPTTSFQDPFPRRGAPRGPARHMSEEILFSSPVSHEQHRSSPSWREDNPSESGRYTDQNPEARHVGINLPREVIDLTQEDDVEVPREVIDLTGEDSVSTSLQDEEYGEDIIAARAFLFGLIFAKQYRPRTGNQYQSAHR